MDWGGTRHQAPTPVYTPNTLGLEISEYERVHNDRNGAYIGWERGTIYFKNTFKYKVRAVEWDISRGGLFDMRGKTWFGNPSNVESQDYTIDNKTDDSNSKIYTSGNDQYLDQISLNTENWSGSNLDLFHLKIRKLIIYYYKPEVIVSLSNIKDSEGKAYTLQNGKDMSVGSTGKLSASLGTKHLGRFVASDVTFKYYSANSNIATIDETTGEISAKSSGSVVLTAKMYDKTTNNEISDASYVLFVFDKNEGMVWTRNNVSVYNNTTGADSWNMSNTLSSGGNDWNASSTLKGGSLIWDIESGVSGVYREFASFSVPGNALYRTIAQNISCTVSLPKYSSMDYKPIIAGSLMTEDVVEYGVRYGLEVVDLGKQNNSTSITWNTNSTADNTSSVGRYRTGSTPYTILRGGAENNKEENKLFGFINIIKDANDNYLPLVGDSYQVGSNNNNSAIWKGDNKNGASIQEVTYNLAVMSYLWGSTIKNYPASSLFGYSGVPEYTYYAHVSFYDNYKDDEAADFIDRVTLASRGRNVAAKLSHSSFVPNREGYRFLGWSTVKGATTIEYQDQGDFYCFDPVNGGGKGEVKLYAVWESKKYSVALHPNGGTIPGKDQNRSVTVLAKLGEPMPSVTNEGFDVAIPNRTGYKFGGYFTEKNGGTMYYNENMQSVRNWDIDFSGSYMYLYAHWVPTYTVTLDAQGGTGGSTTVIATLGEKLPSGLTAPVKYGYEFKGFYSSQNQEYAESMGQDYGGTQYYDKDMAPVNSWNLNYNATIYAHWKPKKFIVTLDGTNSAVVPKQLQYDSQKAISDVVYNSEGVVKISFTYEGQCPNRITNGKFKKAGFKLLGFYDADDDLVAYVDVANPADRNIYFNENSKYWKKKDGNLVWNYTDDLTLTAKYAPKYTLVDGNIIDFGTEYLEVGIDWENSMVHDLLGAAEAEYAAGTISSTNPVMVFDIRNANYLDDSSKKSDDLMEALKDKDFISPNVLVYLGNGAYNVVDNEVTIDNKCTGLVVTDRIPMKIPYGFTAQKATYQRNKAQKDNENDAMWQQSKESVWGTLCLPYPITNNKEYNESGIDYKIRFYELYGTHDNYMQFREMAENQRIEANTPVLYCRTAGVGSAVTVQESSVGVPANIENGKYKVNPVLYSNELKEEMKRNENAERVVEEDWQFKGTLETKKFCTQSYKDLCNKKGLQSEFLEGAEVVDNREIYYFEKDRFTHMTGGVQVLPYRAYFDRTKIEVSEDDSAESKVSSYSILVVDADGTTTDITNLIDNHEAKGNGKIYDLSGRRVKQPVKGSIYIVDGKKKMY